MDAPPRPAGTVPAFTVFLRIYGGLTLLIFTPLLVGFVVQSPPLEQVPPDIPFVLILELGIYLWRPDRRSGARSASTRA